MDAQRKKQADIPPPYPFPSWNFTAFFKGTLKATDLVELHVCRTLWSGAPLLLGELVGTPSESACTVVRAGGWAQRGIDAALYALSTRAAWGRVGHPKEKNLHHESTRLPLISIFFPTVIY